MIQILKPLKLKIVMKINQIKHLLTIAFVSVVANAVQAQGAAAAAAPTTNQNFYNTFLANGLLIFSALVVLGAFLILFRLLNIMIKVQQIQIYQEQGIEAYEEAVEKKGKSFWEREYKRWTNVVPVEKEDDIMFDHSYDGIKELDNSLPPWWVAMFFITIVFSVVYLGYFHLSGAGLNQQEQYEAEVKTAQAEIAAFQAKQVDKVDENNLAVLVESGDLSAGKTLYTTNCVACHGALGEGGVGPNLTDKFWIHGGDIKNIYLTIKNGVAEKGMIAWKAQLRPADMHRVASYIMSLSGTNPPNAKEPQGTEYIPEGNTAPQKDTTATGDALGMN